MFVAWIKSRMKIPVDHSSDCGAYHLLEVRRIRLRKFHWDRIVDQTRKPFSGEAKALGYPKGTGKREIRIVAKRVAAEDNIEFSLGQSTESAIDELPAVLAFDQRKCFGDVRIVLQNFD